MRKMPDDYKFVNLGLIQNYWHLGLREKLENIELFPGVTYGQFFSSPFRKSRQREKK